MMASKRFCAINSASAVAWWGMGATKSRTISKLTRLIPDVSARPGLSASSLVSSKSAAAGIGCGVAPAARIIAARFAPLRTVTWSPRSTRPCATFSSGPMCPIGDSAAIKTSAMVVLP